MRTYYKVLLIVLFNLFCKNSFAQFTVNFTSSSVTACAGETINFTDLSFSPGGVVSWVWDFGDGNSSTAQNPTHTYTSAGTYTVILTANNGSTSIDEVKLNYMVIHPLPQPFFSLSNPSCSLPASVSVSNVAPASGVSYQWDFGNGQTSTSQNPTNPSYSTEGTFNVHLTVTNSVTGCSNSSSQSLNIYNYNTSFTASATTVCVGLPVTFTDNSSPGTDSYSWDFGNGQSSSFSSPSIIYNAAGTYTVMLNSQNTTNGCSDVATQTITVIDAQVPSLSPSLTIGCNPSTVTFTNTSGFNGTFSWNFGNGNTYNGENPPPQDYSIPAYNAEPLYPLSDSFDIIIYSTDENGCTSFQVYQDLITIYNIVPSFNADVTEGCEDLHTTFTDNSYSPIPGFPIDNWQWNFGNGQTYTGQNPPVQTYSEGEYNVSLTVSTAMGCTTTVDSLEVVEVGVPPDVLFTVEPDTLCARQTGTFVNLSSVSVPADPEDLTYYWYIGSQGPYSDFEPNSVPITDTGSLDVTLIISFRGCNDTLTLEDEIYIHAPLVQFSTPGILCNPGIPVQVTINESSILGQQGDNVEVFWDLGDGTTFNYDNTDAWLNNNQSFDHVYTDYGTYDIQQKISNFETGCVDSLSTQLIINYFALDLNFANDSICFGDTSQFHWTYQSIQNFPVVQYHYIADVDFLLGYSYSGIISNPDDYFFESTGEHQIFVSATNSLGCQATATETVFVSPLPEAGIAPVQVAGCVPTTAVFNDASTSISGVSIVDYSWTFNGVTPTTGNGQPTITTTIENTDLHNATLQVTDALGCTGTATLQTEFLEPVADFEAPSVICNNSMFVTSNLSANYTSSEWYLNGQLVSADNGGDFLISHPDDPNVLSYTDSITLIVTDANGCTSELTLPVTVSSPNAAYSFNFTGSNVDDFGNFTCPSVFAAFTDGSESYGDIVNWSWDFGDGKFSSLQNPGNTYVFAGTYTSSLTITDEFGCQDSAVFNDFLTINGPSGTFDVGPAGTLCDPNYLFSSLTLNNVSNVEWFPGDGSSFSSLMGDEHIYADAGTYFPYVTITDNNNCAVTYYLDTLTVQFGNLNAAFTATPLVLNWGEPLVVVNQSTGGNGGIVNNSWSFGNDNFNNQSSQFNYLFNEAGELQILLIVTDAIGCIDSAWISVIVTDNLELPNVFSPNGDGLNDVLRIRDNAYGEYDVIILNRWGNEMSRAHIVNGDYLWDGKTRNGTIATEGVYYYFVKGLLRNGKPNENHGFFHLVMPE